MNEFGEKLENVEYYRRPGSYGVAIRNGRIGVIKSNIFDKYFLIGGGIERGESEIEALQREIFEEIGFAVGINEKIGVSAEYFFAASEGKYICKICNFYRVELKNKIQATAENELIWIDKNSLGEMYHRSHQWIIETQFDQIKI